MSDKPKPKGKPPVDEDAHFRIDDIERKLVPIEAGMKPEVVAALVHGIVAALDSRDSPTRELITTLKELIDVMKEKAT